MNMKQNLQKLGHWIKSAFENDFKQDNAQAHKFTNLTLRLFMFVIL